MLNKCFFIGNVGRDPEIRYAQNGNKIANFSIAVTDKWKDKSSGERKERTEWIRCVVFNEALAGVVEQYVKKGSKLHVMGKMVTRKWQGNDGVDKYTTEIVLDFGAELTMLDGKSEGNTGDKGHDPDWNEPGVNTSGSNPIDDSDTIPF